MHILIRKAHLLLLKGILNIGSACPNTLTWLEAMITITIIHEL